MRGRFAAALCASLVVSGCGSGGPDFSIAIEKPSFTVMSELLLIKPNVLTVSAKAKSIGTERPQDNVIVYTLPAKDGGETGEVRFEVVKQGENASRLDVTVDVPYVTRENGANRQYLSESRMENVLRKSLRAWEKRLESDGSTRGQLREVSMIVSAFGLGLQNFEGFEERATGAMVKNIFNDSFDAPRSNDWGGGGFADEGGSDDWGEEGGGWGSEPG